jgi:hypothetical protein
MTATRRNRSWIWFFVIVGILATAAVTIMILFNQSQQLTRVRLDTAWQKWDKVGPKSYLLVYKVWRGDEQPDRYVVKVRHGQAVSLELNGLKTDGDAAKQQSMSEIFNWIDRFLRDDSEPNKPRVYTRAVFDPDDGHVRNYVRRVMGSRERVEIDVEKLTPLSASE